MSVQKTQNLKWKIQDFYSRQRSKVLISRNYNLPNIELKKSILTLAGLILTASIIIPGAFPMPLGLFLSAFIIKQYGYKKAYMDLR